MVRSTAVPAGPLVDPGLALDEAVVGLADVRRGGLEGVEDQPPAGRQELAGRAQGGQPLLVAAQVQERPERREHPLHLRERGRCSEVGLDQREPLADARLVGPRPGPGEHRRGAVEADQLVALPQQLDRHPPAADAELDDRPLDVPAHREVEGEVLVDAGAPDVVQLAETLVRLGALRCHVARRTHAEHLTPSDPAVERRPLSRENACSAAIPCISTWYHAEEMCRSGGGLLASRLHDDIIVTSLETAPSGARPQRRRHVSRPASRHREDRHRRARPRRPPLRPLLAPQRARRVHASTPPPLAVVLEHPTLREHRVRRQLAA